MLITSAITVYFLLYISFHLLGMFCFGIQKLPFSTSHLIIIQSCVIHFAFKLNLKRIFKKYNCGQSIHTVDLTCGSVFLLHHPVTFICEKTWMDF